MATVKRVIITSSCAAVLESLDTPRVFTEANWNEKSITEIKEKGRSASGRGKYLASKTLAERAAWQFVEKHKGETKWDLVVLNPPYVFGPVIHEVRNPDVLNESMHNWFHAVFKNIYEQKDLGIIGQSWIDVRDLADAHVLALQKEEVAGNRIIVAEGTWKWQDWINAARTCGVKTSNSDDSYDATKAIHYVAFDTTRAKQLLGMKYRSRQQCTADIIENFKERNWV